MFYPHCAVWTVVALHCTLHAVSVYSAIFSPDVDRSDSDPIRTEDDLELTASYLNQLLLDDPWSEGESPLVYVEDWPQPQGDEDTFTSGPWKRSRYRRYPWKRQNNRLRAFYSGDHRYMCNPTREDVFKLLVAVHDNNNGGRMVNFCNRKRPATAIFTNIRSVGMRRK